MATWPAAPFPQSPRQGSLNQVEKDPFIRSTVGYGPAKRRKRTTSVIYDVTLAIRMDGTDRATLKTFYDTTLNHGVDSFTWVDHVHGGAATYAFVEPINWSNVGPDWWEAQMKLEILP